MTHITLTLTTYLVSFFAYYIYTLNQNKSHLMTHLNFNARIVYSLLSSFIWTSLVYYIMDPIWMQGLNWDMWLYLSLQAIAYFGITLNFFRTPMQVHLAPVIAGILWIIGVLSFNPYNSFKCLWVMLFG